MSAVFHHHYSMPFGFHSKRISGLDSEIVKPHNISIALSWIPIIGALMGAYRFYAGYNHKSVKLNNPDIAADNALMFRGIVEMATLGCAGPLLFVIDIITTCGRACTQKSEGYPCRDWADKY